MTIIVEDGTGKADAESYISVADATSYHSARGNAAWAALASDTVREQLLRKATEYMQQTYYGLWKGTRSKSAQALDWPRSSVVLTDRPLLEYVETDTIPTEVKRACAELALKANDGDLAPDLERGVVKEQIGPIAVEYDRTSPQQKRYQAIDLMLSRYLVSSGAMTRLERV